MSNKSNGTAFEKEFAQVLSDCGFWAHLIQDSANGQPFDIIAAKNGRTYVIDCKDCEGNRFQLSRVEDNQSSAMRLWEETGNSPGLYAIRNRRTKEIFIAREEWLENRRDAGRSYINLDKEYALMPFSVWVRRV